MWKFSGTISYTCDTCGDTGEFPIDDFSIECFGGSERQMGAENLYEILYEFDCPECSSSISLHFEASEYPIEFLNFVLNKTAGAQTTGEPEMEHLREIYSAEDLFHLHESISELISALKQSQYLLDEVTTRQFEEIVAEVFRSKGFEVDLTKRTRDGGKDIIAVHTDGIGIKNKYFVECKRYAESNKISVDVVRTLYGVMNTMDGPNKAIIVTTSTFTDDARKFVKQEARSSWDLALVDRIQLLDWLDGYKES
ncbi:endonuclease [Salinivibrio kushneri]|uniref:Endonuclease n=1 Tax=Salinivibrio kushneri TaxID=1908198 RepID=A0AB36JTZ4_9GAMM|nr:restriction endonuclease [Salinivibrio kushneri]OOE36996.1 endonuclease [Salinivibrio kushneri]QCP01838.1 restriction endonuclease [Salinivibrio kushneri]QCP03511.1 restriction endonuclease [Salinivibrio kushneri]